jgi:hypothetical protein
MLVCLLQINVNVQRETVSHRLLRHPNIIAFKKVRAATHKPSLRTGTSATAVSESVLTHPFRPRRC